MGGNVSDPAGMAITTLLSSGQDGNDEGNDLV